MKIRSVVIASLVLFSSFNCSANNEHIDVLKILDNQTDAILTTGDIDLQEIGRLKNGTFVYAYLRSWNDGARVTTRLLFISSAKQFLGAYAINDLPSRVTDNCVFFPYPEEYGNSICVKGYNLPENPYLDGENPLLIK